MAKKTPIRELTRLSLLTAVALILWVVEEAFPPPVPAIPGLKLGLSNVVTVYAVFAFSPAKAALLVTARVLLSALISANPSALLYSACGSVFCLAGMLSLRKILTVKQMPLLSVLGALLFQCGQVLCAALTAGSLAPVVYLPPLLLWGALAGLVTGICARAVVRFTEKNRL